MKQFLEIGYHRLLRQKAVTASSSPDGKTAVTAAEEVVVDELLEQRQ